MSAGGGSGDARRFGRYFMCRVREPDVTRGSVHLGLRQNTGQGLRITTRFTTCVGKHVFTSTGDDRRRRRRQTLLRRKEPRLKLTGRRPRLHRRRETVIVIRSAA